MYETEVPENGNKRKSSGIRRNQNNVKTNKSCYPDLNWRPHPYQLLRMCCFLFLAIVTCRNWCQILCNLAYFLLLSTAICCPLVFRYGVGFGVGFCFFSPVWVWVWVSLTSSHSLQQAKKRSWDAARTFARMASPIAFWRCRKGKRPGKLLVSSCLRLCFVQAFHKVLQLIKAFIPSGIFIT